MATSRQQPPWKQPTGEPLWSKLRIYNSLTKSKEIFVPQDPQGKKVTWYACGPTVYDDAHLGHARNYVSTDILRRILKDYFHFEVNFVMNITDVDDKIILRARQKYLLEQFKAQNKTQNELVSQTVAAAYTAYLNKNLPSLPDQNPKTFRKNLEQSYARVLRGEPLEGEGKAGDKEAKVKMHIKTVDGATDVVQQLGEGKTVEPYEAIFDRTQDILLPYLDSLHGSKIDSEDHSIFTGLTKNFEARFMRDMRDLNVLDPDEITRVTEYGKEIADFVDRIVKNEFGYATSDGSVYFDIEAFEAAGKPYARLEPWNRNDKDLQADGEGALTKKTTEKRSDADFALWKASKPGEPSWNSPWGKGRPGWHIECSAMASAKFGAQMDMHSGGIDLAFPHHDNELAQSEAYWHKEQKQWVNYFLHMGHLSISGAKMSKSLKNFTTIREALEQQGPDAWTPRSLRIVFLLGGWKDGIEVTPEVVKNANAWEDKVDNFFLNARDAVSTQESSTSVNESIAQELQTAEDEVKAALLDSFDTPTAMQAIARLITTYNTKTTKAALSKVEVEAAARWVTNMVNTFGLNGKARPDSGSIGWSGIDIPQAAEPYVLPLSSMRDDLRAATKSKSGVSKQDIETIVTGKSAANGTTSDASKQYAKVLSNFTNELSSIGDGKNLKKDVLDLCDRLRDVDLWDLGIALEDRDGQPALVRPVTKELRRARTEREELAEQNRLAKASKAKSNEQDQAKEKDKAREKAEKARQDPLQMFRTKEYSAWDDDGVPTKDEKGEDLAKSRTKKLRKEWDQQRKAHEKWRESNGS